MVKLVVFLKRKPGMSREDFYHHWQENHGPLIRSLPDLARHIVRYEQHRRLPGTDGIGSKGFDGAVVQWFNSMEDFTAFVEEPDYAKHIYPDEEHFLDRDGLVWMMTEEPQVVIGDQE
jgi:uncharacterized protein (TIGR02118 family)